jgi:protein TonB
MSATTVNAFPPLHSFNSSRSWFLALIVLVHLGFFWALTHGLTIPVFKPKPPGDMFFVPDDPVKPPPKATPIDVPVVTGIFVPPTFVTPQLPPESHPPILTTGEPPPLPPTVIAGPGAGPLIVEPIRDPRYPFTEPEYPVSEIRQGHEGTVLLRVEILPNGRVGDVQIEHSSGFAKLDESATREAKRYRMRPGARDGVATTMWVRVPVSFRLKDR